ncbi:hypothetical protein RM190_20090 [Paracoccus sp. CPCC 101403]|uniref:Uncharacterized protein n=2 Tax=Paracoccus broussonetiae TaxID=3075834 RepID=A0ABU3EIV1_9RHOB|nr:hypothetical protein [Paracoccus sp. CPCC 101403]MDT1064174.1 hypothetical protein [Paracoccus sp. CPCC 101403]
MPEDKDQTTRPSERDKSAPPPDRPSTARQPRYTGQTTPASASDDPSE